MAGTSPRAIYATTAGSLATALTRCVVAAITGNSATLSERTHSAVDTRKGGVILLGIRRCRKLRIPSHPFGHGEGLHCWALIVAILLLSVSGGVSPNVRGLHEGEPAGEPIWAHLVLTLAMWFGGYAWHVRSREFGREKGGRPLWHALRASKDPTTFAALSNDSAAMLRPTVPTSHVLLIRIIGDAASGGSAVTGWVDRSTRASGLQVKYSSITAQWLSSEQIGENGELQHSPAR